MEGLSKSGRLALCKFLLFTIHPPLHCLLPVLCFLLSWKHSCLPPAIPSSLPFMPAWASYPITAILSNSKSRKPSFEFSVSNYSVWAWPSVNEIYTAWETVNVQEGIMYVWPITIAQGKTYDCWWKLWACLCLAIRLACELSFSCIEFYVSKCWTMKIILKTQNIPHSQKDGWLCQIYITYQYHNN